MQSLLCGTAVGSICGFVGAGGGMMMLLVLVSVLGYELKTAVGTSVFIMAFTALTGAVSHFAIGNGITDLSILLMCIVFTWIFAVLTAKFANLASEKNDEPHAGLRTYRDEHGDDCRPVHDMK